MVDPMNKDSTIKSLSDNKSLKVIIIMIILLILGFSVAWLAEILFRITNIYIITCFIILPIPVYLILQPNKVSKVKAPGGWEAEFVVTANKTIELSNQKIMPDRIYMIVKGRKEELEEIMSKFDPSKPIIMTVILGNSRIRYTKGLIRTYIEKLSPYKNVKFVVFLNQDEKLVAYAPLLQLASILQSDSGDDFVQQINNGDVESIQKSLKIKIEKISEDSTNIKALRKMDDQNLEAIIVADQNQRIKGIVFREQIINKLIFSLAEYSG
jgi:hypothetical protein